MKKYLIPILCLVCLIGFVFSCKKTADPFQISDPGYDYFPLEIGKFIEYEVDSTVFSLFFDSVFIQTKTLAREEIVDTLRDNTGQLWYKVERYERPDEASPWTVRKVFTMSRTEGQAFRMEDNLKLMPLVFPVRENKSWNGNIFIDTRQEIPVRGEPVTLFHQWSSHRMKQVGEPDTLGGFQFNETLTVSAQNSASNTLEMRRWTEKYAKGVGLYYRELWMLDTQCENCCDGDFNQCDNLPWTEKAEKGFILKQTILNYN
ncbi:MAG: hypothetical protein D6714_11760 [Bacteroidetes bacterium]|nr:MAG: hypothetical protein D6714_11760 [Bacteroidota bacterium]